MFCSKCGAVLAENASFCGTCGQPMPPAQPGSAPAAPVPQPTVAGRQVFYAGFWLRFVAYIIDSFVLGIPVVILVVVLLAAFGLTGALGHIHPGEPPEALLAVFGIGFIFCVILVALVGGWLYYAMMESSPKQATLGKMALGLYVTDMEGLRVSFGRASGRLFSKIITHLIPLAIGWILAGFTAKKQALHDMIASCLVLRKE
jgi:uncharacterized RDD family membrane protein YckC